MEKYKDINVKKILKDQTYSVIAELAAAVCVLAACWIYFYKGYYRLNPISVVVTLGLLVLYAAILWKLERRLKNEAKRQLQEQGSDAG
ncbi:MAG: hypothetical protein ACLRMW_00735 [[Clostridium] symbiosum]